MSTLGPVYVDEPPDDPLATVWTEAAAEIERPVRAMGVPPGRAEDVLQDVYLTGWQKRPGGLAPTELRRWLFRVAVNRCDLEHRRQHRWQRLWQGWLASTAPQWKHVRGDAAEAAGREEDRKLVRKTLDRIEPLLRTILVLRYFAELDSQEIGKILELPDSTVRSYLRAGWQQLALELKRAGYESD